MLRASFAGTVGIVIPGCHMKIAEPKGPDGSGEILAAGRGVGVGYLYDEPRTAEQYDSDGESGRPLTLTAAHLSVALAYGQ